MKKLLLLLLLLASAWFPYQLVLAPMVLSPQGPAATKPASVNVVVATAQLSTVRDEVEAIGTNRAYESVTITPKIT
ncbi:MAG: efflux RND transporter periplasmic adaptor subunit, partial [Shewanella sp.]